MTIYSPSTLLTGPNHFEAGQAAGAVTLVPDMVDLISSFAGMFSSTQSTAGSGSWTLALADRGTRIRYNNAASGAFTVPPNASVAFEVDTVIMFCQVGAGQLTIAAGAGVTLQSPSTRTTRAQWSTIAIQQDSANVWVLSGDLT